MQRHLHAEKLKKKAHIFYQVWLWLKLHSEILKFIGRRVKGKQELSESKVFPFFSPRQGLKKVNGQIKFDEPKLCAD